MTPPPGLPDPADNPDIYSAAVGGLYLQMPDTPFRPGADDHRVARSLFERGVPLDLVEAALLLASLRRLVRPPGLPPRRLPPLGHPPSRRPTHLSAR